MKGIFGRTITGIAYKFQLVLFGVVVCCADAVALVTVPGDYPTIQSALDDLKAENLPNGEIIEVSAGVYNEALTYAEGARSFTLRSVAGPGQTTINASGTGRSAIFIRNTAANIEIRGFTVTGGDNASGGGLNFFNASATLKHLVVTGNSAYTGGGLEFNQSSSSTIENCTIRNNVASKAGGGISMVGGSNVTILNSRILGNVAGSGESIANGGGIRVGHSTLSISNSTISGNSAKFAGGGIFAIADFGSLDGPSTLTVEDSLISDNTVVHDPGKPLGTGGGIHIEADTTAQIIDTVVVDNFSSGKGAGLNTFQSRLEVTGSLIEFNEALEGTGGGVHGFSQDPHAVSVLLVDSVVRNNTAERAGGVSIGGDGCMNGGVCADIGVEGLLVADNTATSFGGGLNFDNFDMTDLGSLVLGNLVTDAAQGTGGGYRLTTGYAFFNDTTIAGNFAGTSGGGIYVGNATDIVVDQARVFGNLVTAADKGGGLHVSDAGPPVGTVQNSVIANNAGFQIREQSCPPGLPAPILSYLGNNISNSPLASLYFSPCLPPADVHDIGVFNALSPGVKTVSNYATQPGFTVFTGIPLPRGGSVLAWVQSTAANTEISGVGSFDGPMGTVDVLPACTSTYWLNAEPVVVPGTGESQLDLTQQSLRGKRVFEALDSIRAEDAVLGDGADITLRAGNTVAISGPFAVNSGSALRVQTDPDLCTP